jgi:ABC-type cobalt transport system substrate-binding protein
MSKAKNGYNEDHFGGHDDPEEDEVEAPRTWEWHYGSQGHDEVDDDNDCIISTDGFTYNVSCEGHWIGYFKSDDAAVEVIKHWQDDHHIWCNIWFVNDHGNISSVVISDKK